MIVIGLLSGTSADGIDAAVVRLEGYPPGLRWEVLAHRTQPHPSQIRAEILACCEPTTGSVDRVCALNVALGRTFAQAALEAIDRAQLTPSQVDLIGSHGQTIWHIPTGAAASTLQIGEPAVIAELTGLPVVSNFRPRDMAAGGQGAPLVAYVDALLLTHPERVRAAQNIGGIANVTYLPPTTSRSLVAHEQASDQGKCFAFDTGPGNMILDAVVQHATGGKLALDQDGALAARGQVDEALLGWLLDDPYFHQPPPKTTGRERFGMRYASQVWGEANRRGIGLEHLLSTLTAFTAQTIARAYRDFLPRFPEEVIVSGGGARNPVLMANLGSALAPAQVISSGALGLSPDAKEAVAFAVLAYESWHGRPGNLPAATGARRAVILGNITAAGTNIPQPSSTQSSTTGAISSLTESRNPATEQIDALPTIEMVRLMNAEDARVPSAVAIELPRIAEVIDQIAARMRAGGRLIYVGAGTSGRLAIQDAVECRPTFGVPPELVIGLIAGGERALSRAVEGAEDDAAAGARDLALLDIAANDSVVGVAASGATPYVVGAMEAARSHGALLVSIACNRPSAIEALADVGIAPLAGPEVITGSTRLKAGTAQKLVLNMISTGVMIRLGKTFGNLMVDLQATNAKLRRRSRRIVQEACGIGEAEADAALRASGGEVKVAIVATLSGATPDQARRRLLAAGGVVRQALQSLRSA